MDDVDDSALSIQMWINQNPSHIFVKQITHTHTIQSYLFSRNKTSFILFHSHSFSFYYFECVRFYHMFSFCFKLRLSLSLSLSILPDFHCRVSLEIESKRNLFATAALNVINLKKKKKTSAMKNYTILACLTFFFAWCSIFLNRFFSLSSGFKCMPENFLCFVLFGNTYESSAGKKNHRKYELRWKKISK